MFTIPVTSGGLGTWRPTASTGTGFPFTDAPYAYDLPSSRPDDPPYTTYASSGPITSTSGAGVIQYNTAEFNTFKQGLATSLPKSNFSQCVVSVGISTNQASIAFGFTGTGPFYNQYVTANIAVQYQVDGTNWVTIKNYPGRNAIEDLVSPSALAVSSAMAYHETIVSDVITSTTRDTISVTIPSSAFSSNLNNLKVRIHVGTVKDASGAYASYASYQLWDIRANIT